MRAKRYTSQFANQFKQEHIVITSSEEQQFDHLMLTQFAGNEQEPEWLAKQLSQTIHDVPLIGRMISIMENEALPYAALLAEYSHELKEMFVDFASEETYTSTYFNNLVSAVTDLHELTVTFKRDSSEHLLDKLKLPLVLFTAPDRVLDIDSDTIRKIDNVIEYYLDNFDAYDNYFSSLIRQEEANEKQVAVASQVVYYLSRLVSFTDTIINHLQATREILFAWEIQLSSREMQELYN